MNMYASCQEVSLAWDMNNDLAFSITDVWLIIKTVWLLPSYSMVQLISLWLDSVASFFEFNCDTGLGIGGALVSGLVWLYLGIWVARIYEDGTYRPK